MKKVISCMVGGGILWIGLQGTLSGQEAEIRFNRDVRPILSENCFLCHGPDKNERKAGLRLDQREGLFGERDGKKIVQPGQPSQSLLMEKILTADADDVMPPPESGRTLTKAQKDILQRWIEGGAEWEGHWAYEPLRRPSIPQVKNQEWPIDSVDYFVLSRLEEKGFEPAPEATRRELIRRLSYDLTGLPPTYEEVEEFENDTHPQAYERLVERLMTSPHYGERMAMYWLDLVRYADTVGYHGDQVRSVWPYRDYVIESFNLNVPFDRFTREQLAGDLLPNRTQKQWVASGYNMLNMSTEEGGSQPKEFLAKYMSDRVRNVSMVWMGATMGCAECHDHKFDPFSTEDFYRLGAFFADVSEPGVGTPRPVPLPDDVQQSKWNELDRTIQALEKKLETSTPDLDMAQSEWEANLSALSDMGELMWRPVNLTELVSKEGMSFRTLSDGSRLATGEFAKTDVYEASFSGLSGPITGIRLEAMTHPSMDKLAFSKAGGNFVLSEFEVELAGAEDGLEGQALSIRSAQADYSQGGFSVNRALDGDAKTGWAVDGHKEAKDRVAVFDFNEPVVLNENQVVKVRLRFESESERHLLGRFRLSVISVPRPTVSPYGLPENVLSRVLKSSDSRSDEDVTELAKYFRSISPLLDVTRSRIPKAKQERDEFVNSLPKSLVVMRTDPRDVRILPRGNWMDESGPVVSPGMPRFLPVSEEGEEQRLSRLDLANWIVGEENPLTARTVVNRFWKLFMGHGISRRMDDLGSQGEWPSHPDLLDWLAVEFRAGAWDVRHIVRTIVTSRTYRQSSSGQEALMKQDPFNRLFGRQSVVRLDAEMIHDQALAVSGLLVRAVGGESTRPYQPAGYWKHLNFPKREYEADQGARLYQRALYTHWQRTFLNPRLKAFDAPTREECTVERTHSNTPQQALVLLNDPTFVEAARVFAQRILERSSGTDAERLNWAMKQTLHREIHDEELSLLLQLLREERTHFQEKSEEAGELISIGTYPVTQAVSAEELAAWTSVARALLNLHESITRR